MRDSARRLIKNNIVKLRDLTVQEGWEIYKELIIQEEIDAKLTEWRNNGSSEPYADMYIKGYIAGLTYAKNGAEKEMAKVSEKVEKGESE